VGELRQAFDGFRSQRRRFSCNSSFADAVEARPSPVDCDQLFELARELAPVHRHEWTLVGAVSRRETFQISPQLPQRQYVLSSGFRAVVVIDGDWQPGHVVGMVTRAKRNRRAAPFPKSDEFTSPPVRLATGTSASD
jgi:hypothetical protein